jgi:hypothetical protein
LLPEARHRSPRETVTTNFPAIAVSFAASPCYINDATDPSPMMCASERTSRFCSSRAQADSRHLQSHDRTDCKTGVRRTP